MSTPSPPLLSSNRLPITPQRGSRCSCPKRFTTGIIEQHALARGSSDVSKSKYSGHQHMGEWYLYSDLSGPEEERVGSPVIKVSDPEEAQRRTCQNPSIELPFEDVIDYRKIAVFVETTAALSPGYVVKKLRKVSDERILEYQRELRKVQRFFSYGSSNGTVNEIWREVSQKFPLMIKLSQDQTRWK